MKEFLIKFTEDEIQLLADLIHNSSPKSPFGMISGFVSKLDTQIREQATPAEPSEEPANQNHD